MRQLEGVPVSGLTRRQRAHSSSFGPERRQPIGRLRILVLLAILALALSACAAGVNEAVDVTSPEGYVAGFWLGLWHGVIAPITFIVSLFTDNVNIYEVHNNGNWYDLGFVLGAGILFGGGAGGWRYRSR